MLSKERQRKKIWLVVKHKSISSKEFHCFQVHILLIAMCTLLATFTLRLPLSSCSWYLDAQYLYAQCLYLSSLILGVLMNCFRSILSPLISSAAPPSTVLGTYPSVQTSRARSPLAAIPQFPVPGS